MLNKLYQKYGLTPDDVYKHKHYTIINRQGIDKIQAIAKIKIEYTLEYNSEDSRHIIIKATGQHDDRVITSFGESSPDNYIQRPNTGYYPVAMAEKRAMSRVVLKLTGFYALGHFTEEEADEFKE